MIVKLPPFTLLSPFSPSHSPWLTFWAFSREKWRHQGECCLYQKRPSSTQLSTPAIFLQRQREKNNAGRQSIVAQEDSCAAVCRCKYCGLHHSCCWNETSIMQSNGEFQSGCFGVTRQWLTLFFLKMTMNIFLLHSIAYSREWQEMLGGGLNEVCCGHRQTGHGWNQTQYVIIKNLQFECFWSMFNSNVYKIDWYLKTCLVLVILKDIKNQFDRDGRLNSCIWFSGVGLPFWIASSKLQNKKGLSDKGGSFL